VNCTYFYAVKGFEPKLFPCTAWYGRVHHLLCLVAHFFTASHGMSNQLQLGKDTGCLNNNRCSVFEHNKDPHLRTIYEFRKTIRKLGRNCFLPSRKYTAPVTCKGIPHIKEEKNINHKCYTWKQTTKRKKQKTVEPILHWSYLKSTWSS